MLDSPNDPYSRKSEKFDGKVPSPEMDRTPTYSRKSLVGLGVKHDTHLRPNSSHSPSISSLRVP